ncbi:signal peptidase II [Defluviimonas sp. WL0075]|uniref:Lipoprotein signal peptidase n=1 Tax=Albidovulum sediminicola TaxID=2984331 RepID=A0ABT2Z7D8_9RHOB|nr:signal peptidase II [Defluviimonas sp. WL0075]MCV2866686.1 signal peptidase II [Defluviimonas sp. WL0075]
MRPAVIVALVILLADQASKWAVVEALDLRTLGRIEVWPPFLTFQMAWNEGVNFGLLANGAALTRWFLIALALGISAWVWLWIRGPGHSAASRAAAGLLIGGAIGNVIDRLRYGAVADFLNMSVPGIQNPYSFNVADIAIFVGAIGLVLLTGRDKTP